MFHEKYLYFELNGTDTNDLLFVIFDKKLASTIRLLCFFFSFLFGLHSRGRPELHQSSYLALCKVEELAAAVRYHH